MAWTVTCHAVVYVHVYITSWILLQSNFRLQELDLSHNEFCEEGGVLIGPSLGEFNCHTELAYPLLRAVSMHGALRIWYVTSMYNKVWECLYISFSLLLLR